MEHIKQICVEPYTVVVAEGNLAQHPSVLNNPELFEVVNNEIPDNAQYLNYSTE